MGALSAGTMELERATPRIPCTLGQIWPRRGTNGRIKNPCVALKSSTTVSFSVSVLLQYFNLSSGYTSSSGRQEQLFHHRVHGHTRSQFEPFQETPKPYRNPSARSPSGTHYILQDLRLSRSPSFLPSFLAQAYPPPFLHPSTPLYSHV